MAKKVVVAPKPVEKKTKLTKKLAKKTKLTKKLAKKMKLTKKLAKKMDVTPVVGLAKGEVVLVSFTVSAVIPTQQYGNIQPKVEVLAGTMEEARDAVMPFIVDLYKTYAETPLNGKEPKFYGKIEVTEKVVSPPVAAPVVKDISKETVEPIETGPTGEDKPKSDAVLKAEKAIGLAMSVEAAQAIQDQIEKSVKILPEDKPGLYTLCLKKKKELKK